ISQLLSSKMVRYFTPAILLGTIASFWYLKSKKKRSQSKKKLGHSVWGHCALQGRRPNMEDRHVATQVSDEEELVGVFDGHSGIGAAEYAAATLTQNFKTNKAQTTTEKLIKAFETTDKNFLTGYQFQKDDSGTTAVVAVVNRATKKITIAHAGDSRALLIRNGREMHATQDHKPNTPEEKQRIEQAKGQVYYWGCWRVNGLAVSRSIGDRNHKKVGVIATPDTYEIDTQKGDIVVLACDGVFDVMSNQEVVNFVNKKFDQQENPTSIARALVSEAYNKNSRDNISALIVQI
ncbi:MAG: PP2C family protein-serine/threonine phosphatase, partial [Candidatus Babeliales bacterium]